MKKLLTVKNIVLLVLVVLALALAISTGVLVRQKADTRRQMDALFTQSYNELLLAAHNGLLADTQNAFGPYDAETAKDGRLMTVVFPYTSYANDTALQGIVKILNDWVGEHRLYPEQRFDTLYGPVFRQLFSLSENFGDKAATAAALEALQGVLEPADDLPPEGTIMPRDAEDGADSADGAGE